MITMIMKFNEYNQNSEKSFIWIHGLPGSGKTTLANKIMSENKDKNYVLLDDVGLISQVEDERGSNIILNSPYFEEYIKMGLDQKLRNYLATTDYILEEYWFENDIDKCRHNIINRKGHKLDAGSILGDLIYFSKNYKIPSGVKQIPIPTSG